MPTYQQLNDAIKQSVERKRLEFKESMRFMSEVVSQYNNYLQAGKTVVNTRPIDSHDFSVKTGESAALAIGPYMLGKSEYWYMELMLSLDKGILGYPLGVRTRDDSTDLLIILNPDKRIALNIPKKDLTEGKLRVFFDELTKYLLSNIQTPEIGRESNDNVGYFLIGLHGSELLRS